ncbi:hypothetical protein LIER_31427 [Lithospermum erythrorhizon]|uniref:Uncharacterized protein n=1 Tax=Lithospermum erythrorhizon TaxID=34254 RepID=A0AAV3RQX9_LITER
MISTKKLIKMAKKWQKFTTHKKQITFQRENSNGDKCTTTTSSPSASKASKGHFVVYSADKHRFEIPLFWLNNETFQVLLEMAEEAFGLPNGTPIVLPVDGQVLNYIISVIKRGVAGDVHKALISTVALSQCSISSLHQEMRHGQLLVY